MIVRSLIAVALSVVAIASVGVTAYAEDVEFHEETVTVAEEAGVDSLDLQGAVNTTGLEPREYAYQAGHLERPQPVVAPRVGVIGSGPFGLIPQAVPIARCESAGFRPDVIYGPTRGSAGEIGLAQLHPRGLLPMFHSMGFTNAWDPWQSARFLNWAILNGLRSHWNC